MDVYRTYWVVLGGERSDRSVNGTSPTADPVLLGVIIGSAGSARPKTSILLPRHDPGELRLRYSLVYYLPTRRR